MEKAAFISAVVLFLIAVILAVRQIIIRKELRSISAQLSDILDYDTNALITVFSHNKELQESVSMLNSKLAEMRKKELALNSRNTEIGTAITNISHDLRTPLTAVRGYIDLIKGTDDMPEIDRYIEIIDERTQAMKNLTEELFRYSLVLADKEVKKEKVCLNSVLEESLAANYTLLTDRAIIPVISITDTPVECMLDKDSLSRIFGNIISNAAKYSDGDLYVAMDENGSIKFTNTASALDEIQVSRLFDRFYTVTNARSSTGIGLSIAKHLTETLGGDISAVYQDGRISIFLRFN